jgi:hypothetical protein
MYIVQNISDKEISLSDLKISLKPNQKIDLDLSYNRHNIEKSSSLSIGINKGIIKILRKDDIFSKTEEKNNTSITKDNLDEMEKRLSNLMESRLVKSETNVDNSYIQKILEQLSIIASSDKTVKTDKEEDYVDEKDLVDIHTRSLNRLNTNAKGNISHSENVQKNDIQNNIDELDSLL